MLRQIEPALTTAYLLQLGGGQLALVQEQFADLGRCGTRIHVQRMGTSTTLFSFNLITLVWAAVFVNVNVCITTSATNRLVAICPPTVLTRKTSSIFKKTRRWSSPVW